MKKILLLLAITTLSLPVVADEGMWLLPLLRQQKLEEMKKLGLQVEDYDIYNPDSSSLKDAVVIFGSGCTGEFVSDQGLLLTNHHCGYSQIQQHSSLENDYLTNGFWASSKEKELPNPGLTVTLIDKIDDVTEYVTKALEADPDPNGMNYLSPSYLNKLAEKKVGGKFLQDNPGTGVEIKPFYGGNKYYMFTTKKYSDVRLVGAPPSSIGKFGADTDNWMWPRHTGDFSVFRVYADASGNPSEYKPSNVPLKPKKWLKISLNGVKENDFAMILGFPGRTNKFYTSWEVAERRDIDNSVRIKIRDIRQKVMLEEMMRDPQVRIQYASKYASSTNAHKNAIGSNWAINKRNFEKVKLDVQDKLTAWSKQNNKPEYIEAMQALKQIVTDRKDLRFRSWMLDEALIRGIEFTGIPTEVDPIIDALKKKDQKAIKEQLTLLNMAYKRFNNKDYSAAVDKKIAKALLKSYAAEIPLIMQPACLIDCEKKFEGNTDMFIDYLFAESIFGSDRNFNRFMNNPTVKALEADPMIKFAKSVKAEKIALKAALDGFDDSYAAAHKTFVKGIMEMQGEKNLFPDANSTLRLAYGQVRGYNARDAVNYGYRTTLEGVMEKEDPTNWEFVVPDKLKQLYEAKNYAPYGSPEEGMPVAFTANTHTTGGNSGSPVLNGQGELIGLNFDRNWEGVGGDIQYLPEYQRSIIVDIRYVLFLIDKYGDAGYLIDEMDLHK